MRAGYVFRLCALLLVPVLLLSCNTPPDPKYFSDGCQYGVVEGLFRDRWWNFYERGNSYSAGGFWSEAVADYRQALGLRDGDQRRARTYGMHFTDYFPHRDLGVACFHLGRYEEARAELERSLGVVETAKAKFYLNRVRQALIEARGGDATAPTISVESGVDRAVVNCFSLPVGGTVQDDAYAHRIAVNGDPLFIELSARQLPFSKNVRLKSGRNDISIRTEDLCGNAAEKTITVVADFEGPLLQVDNVHDGQYLRDARVMLTGTLADAAGIESLKVNGKAHVYHKEREVAFAAAVDLHPGENSITLAATDIAGNTTRGDLHLVCVPGLAGQRSPAPVLRGPPVRVALRGSGVLDTGAQPLLASARPENVAVRLELQDLADTQEVYYDRLYVDGSVQGVQEIVRVSLNGSPLFIRPGRTIYFSQLIELDVGENTLRFEVEDAGGGRVARTVTVVRRVPEVHRIGSRMAIAILPFERTGAVSGASETLHDNLLNAFFEQDRFRIVSRGAEMEAALRELKLSQTDLVDKSSAVAVGRMVAADAVLTGTIRETPDAVEVYARLINTETAALLDAQDVYGQEKSLAQLRYLTQGLALKFRHRFPLLEGMVIKVSGEKIYADFGLQQQIRKDMQFIVFREGEKIVHPVTGRVLGCDTQNLGVATVVNVFQDMSVGELRRTAQSGDIRVSDLIVTR